MVLKAAESKMQALVALMPGEHLLPGEHSNLIKENEETQRPLNPIHMGSSLMTLTLSPLKGYTSLAVPWDQDFSIRVLKGRKYLDYNKEANKNKESEMLCKSYKQTPNHEISSDFVYNVKCHVISSSNSHPNMFSLRMGVTC